MLERARRLQLRVELDGDRAVLLQCGFGVGLLSVLSAGRLDGLRGLLHGATVPLRVLQQLSLHLVDLVLSQAVRFFERVLQGLEPHLLRLPRVGATLERAAAVRVQELEHDVRRVRGVRGRRARHDAEVHDLQHALGHSPGALRLVLSDEEGQHCALEHGVVALPAGGQETVGPHAMRDKETDAPRWFSCARTCWAPCGPSSRGSPPSRPACSTTNRSTMPKGSDMLVEQA